jgi:nitric oxide reductase NorD protein
MTRGPFPTDDGLDAQRRVLAGWLRMLCGHEVPVHAMPASLGTVRPFLSNLGLHLPAQPRAVRGAQARRMYLASAAHAAAHLAHGVGCYEIGGLRSIQRAVLGVLEDARVERLASRALPGLARLWGVHHVAEPDHGGEFTVLLARLARALADPGHVDPHPWVEAGRRLFERAWDEGGEQGASPVALREAASRLGNDIGQMRLRFNDKTYVVEPAYRDDNAVIWNHALEEADLATAAREAGEERGARPGGEGRTAQPPRQDPSGAARAAGEASAGVRGVAASPGAGPDAGVLSTLARHPEWDRLIGAYRPSWCTVVEEAPPPGDEAAAAATLDRCDAVLRRMRRMLRTGRLDRPVRLRAQPEGDALDLDAAILRAVDRRCGRASERGPYLRTERRRRDLAALVLADLSASTLDPIPGAGIPMLWSIREACLLAGATIDAAGDRCAIDGFCSNGRDDVRYTRFKRFGEPFDGAAAARVAAMSGRLSTRFGAALRHATASLRAERADRRLVLLVTDGEPHDVDVWDRDYLVEDARRAVLEAAHIDVGVFCVTVARGADAWVGRIFGRDRYLVVDRPETLPDRLPELFLRLTRRG